MDVLRFWKNSRPNRKYSFTSSKTSTGSWVSTLVVHDDGVSYNYIFSTSGFVGTPFNTLKFSRDMTASMFVKELSFLPMNPLVSIPPIGNAYMDEILPFVKLQYKSPQEKVNEQSNLKRNHRFNPRNKTSYVQGKESHGINNSKRYNVPGTRRSYCHTPYNRGQNNPIPLKKKNVPLRFPRKEDPINILDSLLFPSREDHEEDHGLDDVVMKKRSPVQEAAFINELDRELENYFSRNNNLAVPRREIYPFT